MKKMLKMLTAYALAAILLLPCIPVLADVVESVSWTTDKGAVILSDTPDGTLPAVEPSKLNNIEVTFLEGTEGYASFIIVPVTGGVPEEATSENTVLLWQSPIEDGTATFSFYVKPSTANGVYAVHIGTVGRGYETKYLTISDATAPRLISGQILQYDDYKKSIRLKLSADAQTDFEEWTAADMRVTLSSGEKSVDVLREHLSFSAEDKTMSIATTGYEEIFPESPTEGNIQQTEISIVTPGYWGDSEFGGAVKGSFGLVIPEFSAEGFKQGVDFEIELYSENALSGADAIVALYDDGLLVSFAQIEDIAISAGETKTIPIMMQSENLRESGKFSLKAMLWDGFSAEPLTSFVLFP